MIVTIKVLVDELLKITEPTNIQFIAKTYLDTYVTKNGFVNKVIRPIHKIQKIDGKVAFWYDEEIKTSLIKEGKSIDDFIVGETWHQPIIIGDKITPLSVHAQMGNYYYLRVLILRRYDSTYVDGLGNAVSYEQISRFIKPSRFSHNQGLDSPLVFRTYGLTNIVSISINGTFYTIERDSNGRVLPE